MFQDETAPLKALGNDCQKLQNVKVSIQTEGSLAGLYRICSIDSSLELSLYTQQIRCHHLLASCERMEDSNDESENAVEAKVRSPLSHLHSRTVL